MIGAQLGLEPGVMGQAYLVPFGQNYKEGNEWKKKQICTFIPGWQGYVDLVSRSGRASCWTGAVYEGDEFDASLGSEPFIHHKPDWDADEGRKLLYTYSVGEQKGATRPVVDVWGLQKVIAHRNRYNKVGDRHYSYKDTNNLEMYARKLPLLQVIKYLPKSVELHMASQLDYSAEVGTQKLSIDSVSRDGEFLIDGGTPQTPMEPTPYDEKFELLGMGNEDRAAFLKQNEGKSEAEIHAALEQELDR
jgi:recombination protein RecT